MGQLVSSFEIAVGGAPLAEDIERLLVSAVVDTSLVDPGLFVLSFSDPDRVVLAKTGITIGSALSVKVVSDAHPGGKRLITGEVTALEAEFSDAGTLTVVRGFDKLHRLLRGRSTVVYKNSSYTDVVRVVAQRHGITVGTMDPTSVHDHVVQANTSDWDFLKRLAAEVGLELAMTDERLDFRKPRQASEAPEPGGLEPGPGPLQLVKGANILEFQGVITAADQVNAVQVRGWDEKRKQEVVGEAQAATTSSEAGLRPSAMAGTFAAPSLVSVSTLHYRAGDAEVDAKAIAEHVGATSAEFYAVVPGEPTLQAGVAVSLGLVGEPFDGKYRLTSARHVYTPFEGYTTQLTASGSQSRSLLDLTSGGVGRSGAHARIDGVVTGLVTDAKDPEERCRVKVRLPWLEPSYESDWLRTVQAGAGNKRGTVVVPEVDDEVLVAFEQGDLRRGFVVGGLYNGMDKPNAGTALIDGAGKVTRRGFVSRTGHAMVFFDGAGKEGVALMTGDKGLRISLNKTGMVVKITSNGKVEIKGSKDVNVESGTAMVLKAGTTMSIEAGAKLEIKAPTIAVKGSGPVQVQGTPIQLN